MAEQGITVATINPPISPQVRQAINSEEYVKAGKTSVFQGLPPVEFKTEEEFQDKVVIEINDEKYEILPYSQKRMKVIRHYEVDGDTDIRPVFPDAIPYAPTTTRVESHRVGEGDRELAQKANKILTYERVTYDPQVWDTLQRLRTRPQELVIKLPHGYMFDRETERQVQALIEHLALDEIKPALEILSTIQARVDKTQAVLEHPGLPAQQLKFLESLPDPEPEPSFLKKILRRSR